MSIKSNQRIANDKYRANFDRIIWNSIEKAISCKDSTKSESLEPQSIGKNSFPEGKA